MRIARDWIDFLLGQVDALKGICVIALVTHPQREKLLELLKDQMGKDFEKAVSDSYKDGMQDIFESVQTTLPSVLYSEIALQKSPGSERH